MYQNHLILMEALLKQIAGPDTGQQVWARNTYQSAFLASSLVLVMLLVSGHECDADGDAQW